MYIDPIDDDVISYKYAPFYAECDPRNVINIDSSEAYGIFTSGMTECVSFAFFVKGNNEVQRLSMIHFPGGMTSYTLDSQVGKEVIAAMVANAPKGAEIEAVIGFSSSHYPNGLFDDEEILEVLAEQLAELGFQLTSLQLCAGNGRNLDESGFSFGINFNGKYGEFINCHGLVAKGGLNSKEACVSYSDIPTNLSQLTYLLNWARLRGDKQRWDELQKDIKRLEEIHFDKDFSRIKEMPFKLAKEDIPLNNPSQLKDMMLRAREGENKELWKQIKTAIVQEIEQCADKYTSLVKYKSILKLHLDKSPSNQYEGSFFSRAFQQGEPTHWRQVKKYDSEAGAASDAQESASIDSESSDSESSSTLKGG
ncbi:hypothetical protein BN59_03048 [Legionella massiliensis]|uniref:Uncharacterized protein n=1 Tax=Legionella massiliensis TaxID=1034943 RepID=A0A078KW95_9GAMM|nr:hypothetical protein [Legionella massiliensis]CDZ78735.1 hypothetical protein BN59_03048 [Legionella massiliensis]CEE14473.1 hypothetical protein BN1094_03048 [Legionella massiliensis]